MLTAQLHPLRGLVLGPRSAKALSNFDSAVPLLRTKKETEAHQRPRIAAPATGARMGLRKERPWTARAALVALRATGAASPSSTRGPSRRPSLALGRRAARGAVNNGQRRSRAAPRRGDTPRGPLIAEGAMEARKVLR
jgi:hypothetical protein